MKFNVYNYIIYSLTILLFNGECLVYAKNNPGNNLIDNDRSNLINFSFPGNEAPVWSVTHEYYLDNHIISKDGEYYAMSVKNWNKKTLTKINYDSGLDGAWSSKIDAFFVNNRIGSTEIDCLVWNSKKNSRLFSLTKIAENGFISNNGSIGHLPPTQRPGKARYALVCEGWSEVSINVSIEGETWSGPSFSYRFVYNVETGLLKELS